MHKGHKRTWYIRRIYNKYVHLYSLHFYMHTHMQHIKEICAFILLIHAHSHTPRRCFKPSSIHRGYVANTYKDNGILCQNLSRESLYLHMDNTLTLSWKHTHTHINAHITFSNAQKCCIPNEYSKGISF